jgi:branched-subunit amino acid transport protein
VAALIITDMFIQKAEDIITMAKNTTTIASVAAIIANVTTTMTRKTLSN